MSDDREQPEHPLRYEVLDVPSSPVRQEGRRTEVPSLDWDSTVDVLEHCSVQHRFVYQQAAPWLCAAVLLWLFVWLERLFFGESVSYKILPALAIFVSVGTLCSVWFWEAYRQQMVYQVKEFRWFSIRGVFLKKVNSTPLTPFSSIEMKQTLLDFLFDTWRVSLHCDFIRDSTVHLLPGLTFEDASKFYRMYAREVDRQMSVSAAALAAEQEQYRG